MLHDAITITNSFVSLLYVTIRHALHTPHKFQTALACFSSNLFCVRLYSSLILTVIITLSLALTLCLTFSNMSNGQIFNNNFTSRLRFFWNYFLNIQIPIHHFLTPCMHFSFPHYKISRKMLIIRTITHAKYSVWIFLYALMRSL